MPSVILPKDVVIREFEDFLLQTNVFNDFQKFIEEKGYAIEEFGMKSDE